MDDRDRVPRGRQSIGDQPLDDDTEGHTIGRSADPQPRSEDDDDDTEGHLRGGGLPGSSRGGE